MDKQLTQREHTEVFRVKEIIVFFLNGKKYGVEISAARTVRIDPDIIVGNFDIHILFDVRHDITRHKRRLPSC